MTNEAEVAGRRESLIEKFQIPDWFSRECQDNWIQFCLLTWPTAEWVLKKIEP